MSKQPAQNKIVSRTTFQAIENGFRLTGAVTLDTAPAILQSLPKTTEDVSVDLSETSGSDSALLALLLAWARQSSQDNVRLSCTNAPTEVSSLIHLYGLETILSH